MLTTMKTPLIRAQELYALVHGKQQKAEFFNLNEAQYNGWLKLGKLVLRLEKRIKKS